MISDYAQGSGSGLIPTMVQFVTFVDLPPPVKFSKHLENSANKSKSDVLTIPHLWLVAFGRLGSSSELSRCQPCQSDEQKHTSPKNLCEIGPMRKPKANETKLILYR